MTQEQFKSLIRNVPDFPKKGIQFKDITTALKNAECLRWIRDKVTEMYRDKGITQVVGLESRGFIIGPAVAMELGAGFVLARKPGKLPADVISASYNKEYGTDTIQLHSDALNENDIVLIHDDLLATGGSMKAACDLVKQMNPKKILINFVIELTNLNGRKVFDNNIEVDSLLYCSEEEV
jgi:adenine phosphoribosyltransferase